MSQALESEPKQQSKTNKILGLFVLSQAVIGGSTIGIVSNYVTADGPLLKNVWRYLCLFACVIVCSPFVYMY